MKSDTVNQELRCPVLSRVDVVPVCGVLILSPMFVWKGITILEGVGLNGCLG